MIKEKDIKKLNKGDILWESCKYHWKKKYELEEEQTYEENKYDNIEFKGYNLKLKNIDGIWNNYVDKKFIDLKDKNEFFLTEKEADEYINKCKEKKNKKLDNKNIIIKELYYKAEPFMANEDKLLYREKIKNMGIKL